MSREINVFMSMQSSLRYALLLLAALFIAVPVAAYERQAADVPQPRVRNFSWMSAAEWQTLHQRNLAVEPAASARVLFTGDSITRGWLSAGKSVWEREYASLGAVNFAINGDTTQNQLWRIINGEELAGIAPEVVVLLIGSNNFVYSGHSSEQVAAGVAAIVTGIEDRLPATRIILLGILPRGADPESRLRGQILRANELIASLDDGERVFYLDFGDQFLNEDGTPDTALMHDSVHLTEQGYEVWVSAMAPLLNRVMRE